MTMRIATMDFMVPQRMMGKILSRGRAGHVLSGY
jgi:hypothetical protein